MPGSSDEPHLPKWGGMGDDLSNSGRTWRRVLDPALSHSEEGWTAIYNPTFNQDLTSFQFK
jgi:hypothetical protein